jgi:hypothetical protein
LDQVFGVLKSVALEIEDQPIPDGVRHRHPRGCLSAHSEHRRVRSIPQGAAYGPVA